jgi:peptide/nickel transport system ATP-binding protein
MIFISHDLKVVRQVSRRIAVMYLGRIVEEGDGETIFAHSLHPYTQALVSAAPVPGQPNHQRIILSGEPPNPAARPSGCSFHPRCPQAQSICREVVPELRDIRAGARVACHLA